MESERLLQKAHKKTQRLLNLLGIKMGALNLSYIFDKNDKCYMVELGARNGGNLISEVIKYCTGVNLIKYTLNAALGFDCSDLKMQKEKKYFAHYVVHSRRGGRVKGLYFSEEIKKNILEEHINIKKGDKVYKFNGSDNRLGIMILKFKTKEEMIEKIYNMEKYFRVCVE